MRKHVISVLILLLIIALSSCGSNNFSVYESIVIDATNNDVGIKSEANYWTGVYFEKNNMINKSCIVENNSYIGSYKKSIIDKMNSYTTDVYRTENNIEFGLRADNEKLVYINFMNSNFFETEPYLDNVTNPPETALSISEEIAKHYVDNINEYTRIIEKPVTRYKEKNGNTYEITYYVITYAKKINGYFSSDYISIKVTSKGNLASIMIGDVGAFENTTVDFDAKHISESISSKINSTYKKAEFQLNTFNLEEQRIVVTPNGEICMYSNVVVNGIDKSNIETKTGISILTVVGYKKA